jgi:stage II sporulation protein D
MRVRSLTVLLICACFLSWAFIRKETRSSPDADTRLQSIAAAALGDREGAIVVVDPQTGHILAAVNPKLAFEHAVSPGSTIKPFTALTALRAGVIDENSRTRCRAEERDNGKVEVCSHPHDLPPLNPVEAIAYSCNYYFVKTGERIKADALAQTLSQFGFNSINRAKWQPSSAIGEGEFAQVTPVQLLMAYTALLNGGHLFDSASGSRQVQISEAERAILLAGMRGAVKYGTAEKANLDSLPAYIVGKTGTATPLRGFRSQGWFVGIAFGRDKPPVPENAQLAVVVYLKNGHGSDAAAIAAPVFQTSVQTSVFNSLPQITVNVRGSRLPLEDYVAHVVSIEGSTEDQSEALKALAVTVRTYALKNLRRHKQDGYDFCSTTHCQRFESTAPSNAAAKAVRETSGIILQDERGLPAESYFGASCGGNTANLETLWGATAPKYLTGVRDDYCNAGPHSHWTDVIPRERLATALRSDTRTDVGENIRELTVAKRDQTGRAELISITGAEKRVISGWEFKLIVGRALGWNVLKSSRFTISPSGSAFVFRGSGFGHGLGLCQEGAHEMGQRGFSFRQILAKYFPGTSVGPQTRQTTRRSSHFRITSPSIDAKDADRILDLLESQRNLLTRRVSSAGLDVQFPDVEIVFNKTTGDFVGRTGLPPWAAAATHNNRIELQPLALLKQRGILETTLRHELVHVVVDQIGGGQTPRWFAEGIALYLAGEGKLLEPYAKGPALSPQEIDRKLASAKSADETKTVYAAAYRIVRDMVRIEGENKLWKRVAQRSYDVSANVR